MTTLRLIADDLTGALDTAAEFTALAGDIPVYWDSLNIVTPPPTAAFDIGTREMDRDAALARIAISAPMLLSADIAYLKVDSLLRGHAVEELAACVAIGGWTYTVFAPAFPFQGRVTQAGRQWQRAEDGWAEVSGDLVQSLRDCGAAADVGRIGMPLVPGISVFDALTDADLVDIVQTVRGQRVLWCGSGGLARAISGGGALVTPWRGPVLGLFGSDQRVTSDQIVASGALHLRLDPACPDTEMVERHMQRHGAALVDFALPTTTTRANAALAIAAAMGRLVCNIVKPSSLIVAGGETLRALCDALGAERLDVTGAMMPGVPRSTLRGGMWNGVEVVSKSGGFGHLTLLRELLHVAGMPHTADDTVTERIGP